MRSQALAQNAIDVDSMAKNVVAFVCEGDMLFCFSRRHLGIGFDAAKALELLLAAALMRRE